MNKQKDSPNVDLSWLEPWSIELKTLSGEHEALSLKVKAYRHAVDAMKWKIGEFLLDGLKKIAGPAGVPSPADRIKLFEKAKEATGYTLKTLRNYAYVAGMFPSSLHRDGLEWSHYKELFESGLDDEQQSQLLASAAVSGWKVRDLQREIRKRRKPRSRQTKRPPKTEDLSNLDRVILARREMARGVIEFMFQRHKLGLSRPEQVEATYQPTLQGPAIPLKRVLKRLPLADLLSTPWRWTGSPSRHEDRARKIICRGLAEHGQLIPIHVFPSPDDQQKFIVVDGNMVVDCARLTGLPDLDAYVYPEIDESVAKLLYVRLNLVRAELNHVRIASVLGELADELGGWPAVAKEMSWDPENVESYVNLSQYNWKEFVDNIDDIDPRLLEGGEGNGIDIFKPAEARSSGGPNES